ncbi:MAG TPA: DMT family transporter [Acidimicrobiales bacterium]|nr:DMT family transporter [Acidimicrobiales bacterium]
MPSATRRPPPADLALLALAVAAVSTAAPLVRVADAPALAIAFWRNALALPVLALLVALGARRRHDRARETLDGRERRLCVIAGVFLGAHFATWVPSLSFTSVASSVALVATQPVWAALIARARGESVPGGAWWGIGTAVAGAVVLSGVDLSVEPRALLGDLLALVGGVLAAAYVTVGADVRRTVSTSVYALVCYGVAAAALLVVCLVGRQSLAGAGAGYDRTTWLALVAMVAGPQLLGHTVVNRVLGTTSATLVSVAILFEIVGSALLAWIAFDEVPPASAIPAALLIGLGVVLVVRSGAEEPAVAGAPAME